MTPEEIKKAIADAIKAEQEKTESYVKGVREEAKGYREKMEGVQKELNQLKTDAAEATRKAAEDAAKAGDGKYEGLYEQAKKTIAELEGKIKELEKTITDAEPTSKALEKYLEAEIEEIPEEKRTLIPNLPVTEKLAWLKEAKTGGVFGKFEKKKAPDHKGAGDPDLGDANPWAKDTYNLTQQGVITKKDPALAASLKKAAGK